MSENKKLARQEIYIEPETKNQELNNLAKLASKKQKKTCSIRSKDRDDKFFAALAVNGIARFACEFSGYASSMIYVWKKNDPEFAQRWKDAIEESIQVLEQEMWNRAVLGDDSIVTSQGKVVYIETKGVKQNETTGELEEIVLKRPLIERKKSDTLAIFLAKSLRPEKYRERFDFTVVAKNDPTPVELSESELEQIILEDTDATDTNQA